MKKMFSVLAVALFIGCFMTYFKDAAKEFDISAIEIEFDSVTEDFFTKSTEEISKFKKMISDIDVSVLEISDEVGSFIKDELDYSYIKTILSDIPEYDGTAYIIINDNIPDFSDKDKLSRKGFEEYSDLDIFGRCGVAYVNVCKEIMPSEERGEIGTIKPSGWQTVKYDFVDGKYLYNRCHLIGYQLSGENANEKNLITGTRYLNIEGMLPFEIMIDDYVDKTDNHVLYRVTPIFDGANVVASGVQLEAWSVEDKGEGICFNVFCYNVQPGVIIDYGTGLSKLAIDG